MLDRPARLALLLALGAVVAVAGCASPGPTPNGTGTGRPAASPAPAATGTAPSAAPATPSPAPGVVGCPEILTCLPVARALRDIPEASAGDGEIVVYAPSCDRAASCPPGIHVIAVRVPTTWRLGDPFRAWSVDGPEDDLTVAEWTRGSLPEDVIVVLRSYVDR